LTFVEKYAIIKATYKGFYKKLQRKAPRGALNIGGGAAFFMLKNFLKILFKNIFI